MTAKATHWLVGGLLVGGLATFGARPAAAATVIPVKEDVMTSSFFIGTNLVRGYAVDARPTMRVSTGDGVETIYLSFDFDPDAFSTPVKAVLSIESVPGGFGGDASPGNPFTVSAHGVDTNPLTAITDDTNPSGPIAWDDFFDNNILDADPAALTAVEGFGTVTFDVSALINTWIDGTNSIFVIALTGKNDLSVDGFLHGFRDNDSTGTALGSTFLTVTAVPIPGAMLLMGSALLGLGSFGRRALAALPPAA